MGTNKFASQQGMTAYGTRRHLYDPKLGTDQPLDQATISLQMGTNKGASQVRGGKMHLSVEVSNTKNKMNWSYHMRLPQETGQIAHLGIMCS